MCINDLIYCHRTSTSVEFISMSFPENIMDVLLNTGKPTNIYFFLFVLRFFLLLLPPEGRGGKVSESQESPSCFANVLKIACSTYFNSSDHSDRVKSSANVQLQLRRQILHSF